MLKRYRIIATLIDPVTQRKSRQSQMSEGLIGIRGTTLRGALAEAYLNDVGTADRRFHDLFLDERRLRFGSLQPWDQPVPLTATSCKRAPGFPVDHKPGHGVVDQLWLRVAEQMIGGPLPMNQQRHWLYCQHPLAAGRICGAAMKAFSGGWISATEQGGVGSATTPATTVDAHVGIDRSTSTASPSIFYALQAIEPSSQAWSGQIQATDEAWEEFTILLNAIDHRIRVGHARTRGYGRIKLSTQDAPPDDLAARHETWKSWSNGLHNFLRSNQFVAHETLNEASIFFSVSLPAGAILIDRFLRFTLDPSDSVSWLPALRQPGEPPQWMPAADADNARIACVTALTKHELVRGWHAAHGLPKTDEYAVVPGGVYVYQYHGNPQWLWGQLDRLREEGIGLRRNEGFGAVTISDPFHQLFSQPAGESA